MTAIYLEAVTRFEDLLARAKQMDLREPTAMTLATSGADGRLSARVVLLRHMDERGFVFYTNLHSDKGRQLAEDPRVALCFHWDCLGEQVRIEGVAEAVSADEADRYWEGRPRESQIGAWASRQSETLDARETLEHRVAAFEERFSGQAVPRPDFWSGYCVRPNRIEFWLNRSARLHERTVYESLDSGWAKRQLYP